MKPSAEPWVKLSYGITEKPEAVLAVERVPAGELF